jgi:hypothetical protein
MRQTQRGFPRRMTFDEGWLLTLKRGRGSSQDKKGIRRSAQPRHVKPQTFQPPTHWLRQPGFAVGIVDGRVRSAVPN